MTVEGHSLNNYDVTIEANQFENKIDGLVYNYNLIEINNEFTNNGILYDCINPGPVLDGKTVWGTLLGSGLIENQYPCIPIPIYSTFSSTYIPQESSVLPTRIDPGITREEIEIPVIPPKKQVDIGVLPNEVVCKESLELIFKSSDGSPACVTFSSATKLVERGWGHR